MLIVFRVSARPSCLNPIEESSSKDELEASNASQEKTPTASQPGDCSLAAESVDTTEKCDTVMHSNALSANVSTSQNSSDSIMDLHTADSKTSSSVSGDNGNEYTVAIERATLPVEDWFTENANETNIPVSIQSDVSDNIEGTMEILPLSSSNGAETNGMESVNLECKPEKPEPNLRSPMEDESEKPVKTTSVAKLKPLISPGFLGKRPRKILNTKKDEKAHEPKQVNGDLKPPCFKNIEMANGGGSNDVGKGEGCLV